MIDKPLTLDKEKPNKPIEDKHLTTWCSWRQIRTLLKNIFTLLPNRHTSVKATTCLHKMGKKHNYSLLLRKFIGRKRCRKCLNSSQANNLHEGKKKKEVSDLLPNVHLKFRFKEVE